MRNILIISILFFIGALFWASPEMQTKSIEIFQKLTTPKDANNMVSSKPTNKTKVNVASRQANPEVVLTADRNGHFTARGMINGSHVDFLVDTGATIVFISQEEARRVGFDLNKLDYSYVALTASGKTNFAKVFLDDVSIGGITVRNVEAAIAKSDDVTHNLLGMTFLSRIKGFEISGGRLIMRD
ncbi:MAG: TIGR02281 family clan AA aspartic protease [Rhizobiales bacterium]|nr:TIGR02281 family clan AA aspartic protease [Hyphomicrobiales bacterium]NRB13056.1 TIGR02281 family clan AA aspartic protease [Hyphomicrobiales bacterium]